MNSMDCPICNQPSKVVRTYAAGQGAKTVERVCPQGHQHVYAVQLVGAVDKRGTGAYAVASKLRRGENPIPAPETHG